MFSKCALVMLYQWLSLTQWSNNGNEGSFLLPLQPLAMLLSPEVLVIFPHCYPGGCLSPLSFPCSGELLSSLGQLLLECPVFAQCSSLPFWLIYPSEMDWLLPPYARSLSPASITKVIASFSPSFSLSPSSSLLCSVFGISHPRFCLNHPGN